MHPSFTYDLIRADHAERLESARLQSRHAGGARRRRPSAATRGRPPEPRRTLPRLRGLLAGTTAVAAIR
jgi:hypothetical protein